MLGIILTLYTEEQRSFPGSSLEEGESFFRHCRNWAGLVVGGRYMKLSYSRRAMGGRAFCCNFGSTGSYNWIRCNTIAGGGWLGAVLKMGTRAGDRGCQKYKVFSILFCLNKPNQWLFKYFSITFNSKTYEFIIIKFI